MLVGMEEGVRREVRRKSVGHLADLLQRVFRLPMCFHKIARFKASEAREGSANLHLDFRVSKNLCFFLSAQTTEKQDIYKAHSLLVNSKEKLHTKTKCILFWHRREVSQISKMHKHSSSVRRPVCRHVASTHMGSVHSQLRVIQAVACYPL